MKLNLLKRIEYESNKLIVKGSLYAMIIAFFSSLTLLFMYFIKNISGMEIVSLWTSVIFLISFITFFISKFGRFSTITRYIIAYLMVLSPLFVFILGYLVTGQSAIVRYLLGPPYVGFYVFTALTIIFYNPKISISASIIAFISSIALFFVARSDISKLTFSDPGITQTLSSFSPYLFKDIFILVIGFTMALASNHANSIIKRFVKEEKEKEFINRLFGEYVSEEVRDSIKVDNNVNQSKKIVVLFSDIRGFSSLSEKYKPDVLVKYLNQYFDVMVECINKNGGVIDKFIGDAVMGTFGGFGKLDNPTDNALKAAKEMRNELIKLNQKWKNDIFIENGIGLEYGYVLQGIVGSKNRKEFTVIGDAVNIASRIEGLTKKYYKIMFSQNFYNKLSKYNKKDSIKIGALNLKGKKDQTIVYGINC